MSTSAAGLKVCWPPMAASAQARRIRPLLKSLRHRLRLSQEDLARNGLMDARDSKGAHTHDDEIEKRECAKEDVTDTSGGPLHYLCLPFTAVVGGPTNIGRLDNPIARG